MSTAEVRAELSELVSGRVGLADGVLPPLLFVTVNSFAGVGVAALAGIGSAVLITLWRLARGRPVRFAVAGLAGTALAVLFALRSGSPDDYFLPGIISGGLTTALIVVSIAARKPFVAWASWLTRKWPLGWYWHPQVRPAYTRASWIWAGFFTLRTLVQLALYVGGDTVALGAVRVLLGWPALAGLLVVTYLLGRRWLVNLGGPSVEEYEAAASKPWIGQTRGF